MWSRSMKKEVKEVLDSYYTLLTPRPIKEQLEHLEDRYLNWVAEYKMEHFSKEIFQELGMEIVKKNKKGFVVRDTTPKNKLN